jgi:hypothetical protein
VKRPKPPARNAAPVSAPPPPSARRFVIPEHGLLSELRHMLSAGRVPAQTPEDHARGASFRVVAALLLFLAEFKRRVERGDRLRIVEREHPSQPGRLIVEFTIEAQS